MNYFGLLRALNIDMYVHYVAKTFQRFVKHLQLEFIKFIKILYSKTCYVVGALFNSYHYKYVSPLA